MLIYLVIFVVGVIWWMIKDYFNSDLYINHSTQSIPLLKTSFNLALRTSGEEKFFLSLSKAQYLLS